MKIFGFSILVWALIFLAFYVGTKRPNALSGIPIIGK